MGEVQRIEDQLERAYRGDAWHGPSLKEILQGIDASTASARPGPAVHMIWEIVLHASAWKRAACRGIGGAPVLLADEEDWPTVSEPSEEAWQGTLGRLDEDQVRLHGAVSNLSESDLERPVKPKGYSVYFLLHGIIQHDLYHAGQIILIRKMVARNT